MWRIWPSACVRHLSTRFWVNSWAASLAVGGRPHHTTYSGLLPSYNAVRDRHVLCSLDLSKAFDHVLPSLAIHALRLMGLPESWQHILGRVWSGHKRILSYDSHVLPSYVSTGASMPQGDSWSSLAMLALLSPPTRLLAVRFPASIVVAYIDDPYLQSVKLLL